MRVYIKDGSMWDCNVRVEALEVCHLAAEIGAMKVTLVLRQGIVVQHTDIRQVDMGRTVIEAVESLALTARFPALKAVKS